jgi:hypothetical protein
MRAINRTNLDFSAARERSLARFDPSESTPLTDY